MTGTPDDPLDPKRWTARGGEGGPITGDEYAYLKELIHDRMAGNTPPDRWIGEPPKKRGFARLWAALRKR